MKEKLAKPVDCKFFGKINLELVSKALNCQFSNFRLLWKSSTLAFKREYVGHSQYFCFAKLSDSLKKHDFIIDPNQGEQRGDFLQDGLIATETTK